MDTRQLPSDGETLRRAVLERMEQEGNFRAANYDGITYTAPDVVEYLTRAFGRLRYVHLAGETLTVHWVTGSGKQDESQSAILRQQTVFLDPRAVLRYLVDPHSIVDGETHMVVGLVGRIAMERISGINSVERMIIASETAPHEEIRKRIGFYARFLLRPRGVVYDMTLTRCDPDTSEERSFHVMQFLYEDEE